MTIARSKLADVVVSRWYHCLLKCVTCAFLLSEGEDSTSETTTVGSKDDVGPIYIGGYPTYRRNRIVDNHIHTLGQEVVV